MFDHHEARVMPSIDKHKFMISKIHTKMIKNAINGKKGKIVLPYIITCFRKNVSHI